MGQVLSGTPYDCLTAPIAGVRIMLREANGLLEYLGSIKEPKFEEKLTFASIFDAGSGAEVELRKVASLLEMSMKFVAQEFLRANIARFMMAGAPTDVAADAVAAHAAETFVAGKTGARYGLAEGRQSDAQQTALKVYDTTEGTAALLVLDTDYKLVRQFSWTFIELLVDDWAGKTIRVGEGVTADTAYHYLKLAHAKINPLTKPERAVSGVLQIVSKTGQNMELVFNKAVLAGGGNFNLQTKEFSNMDFELTLQDDSAANPTAPFGELRIYGYDNAGGALI
ncbi:MAG TPA: hypothetical protein VGP72_14720 [Planctomycetota bacterium]|jgi:hypothetical protein